MSADPTAWTEKRFQAHVLELAALFGWLAYHTYDSRRSAPGYPDLTLVHAERRRIIFAELKTDRGRLTEAQREWANAIAAAGGEYRLWKPKDWSEIAFTLSDGRATT